METNHNSLAEKYAKRLRPTVTRAADEISQTFETAPEPVVTPAPPPQQPGQSALAELEAEVANAPEQIMRSMRFDKPFHIDLTKITAEYEITPESLVQGFIQVAKSNPSFLEASIQEAKKFHEQRQRIGELRKAITRLKKQLRRIYNP